MDLDIDPWIKKIKDEVKGPQKLRQVDGIAELGMIRDGIVIPPTPSVFVVPENEDAGENKADTGFLQNVTESIGVVCVISNVRDHGLAAHNQLKVLRRALKDSLINWTPEGSDQVVEFKGGRLVVFNKGQIIWHDTYTTGFTEYKT